MKRYRNRDRLMDDETKLFFWCQDIEKKTGNTDIWKVYDKWFYQVYEPNMELLTKTKK